MEADCEAAHLLTLQAAWMADNGRAQLAGGLDGQGEGRPGRLRHHAALRRAVRARRLREDELLEKWARDSKILDIFEGTQQIQLLIVARRLLGLSSAELA